MLNNTCPFPDIVSDGWCDDKANTPQCEYDGGDCCSSGKNLKPNGHLFCSNCFCNTTNNNDDMSSRILKPGMCEFCVFPFRNPSDEWDYIMETDCVPSGLWQSHFCPMAVYKDTKKPVGLPFELPCPDNSCFYQDK